MPKWKKRSTHDPSKKLEKDTKETANASDSEETDKDHPTRRLPCIAARQPYAGFILNGVKTIETRWNPVFKNLENETVGVHIAWNEWEGHEWMDILKERGMDEAEIEDLVESGKRHGRGVLAGVFTVGESWKCEAEGLSDEERLDLEKQAVLRPLDEKYLTRIHNAKWLKEPVKCRGQPGISYLEIPETILPK